jgi:hypothetical protein
MLFYRYLTPGLTPGAIACRPDKSGLGVDAQPTLKTDPRITRNDKQRWGGDREPRTYPLLLCGQAHQARRIAHQEIGIEKHR